MTESKDIYIRKSGKAGRITLTRPQALNALSYEMCLAIEHALIGWCENDQVSIVIIDAEGERSFCAGGDIAELYETGKANDFEFGRKFWKDEYRLNVLLANYPKPYIAVMDGIVMGGGVGISAHGSHRIVSENTLFAMPECGIGLVPDVGACSILARAPHHLGNQIGLTGCRLKAADTIAAGFADVFVPATQIQSLINELEKSGDPMIIDAYSKIPEKGDLENHLALTEQYFSKPTALEIVQSLEASNDEWCIKQAKAMRRSCPLSVACAHEIINEVRKDISVENAVRWEYRFTYRSMSDGELLEGIRAQIIDKDRDPKWRRPDLESVGAETIQMMLAPLGDYELNF